MKRVAVYGSLKQGFGNFSVMKRANGSFISSAVSVDDHYILNGQSYPYINEDASNSNKGNLAVEIFEVPTQGVLGPLDSLEGHPTFYERQERNFKLPSGEVTSAWVYIYKRPIQANTCFKQGNTYTW